MKKHVKNTSWVLFSLLLISCGGGGGGSSIDDNTGNEETQTTSPTATSTALQVSAFAMSSDVQRSTSSQVNFNVTAEAEGLVTYRFESIFADFHFKPNSGVIALKDNSGQVVAQYMAPQSPGTYHYTLQIKDSQGLTIEHPFNVVVN